MLREINTILDNDLSRRWFADDVMDLFVWINAKGIITRFQLCYNKNYSEHALTWKEEIGFQHNKVDDGEGRTGRHKGTPILVQDGQFDSDSIAQQFKINPKTIDTKIHEFIFEKLLSFPDI